MNIITKILMKDHTGVYRTPLVAVDVNFDSSRNIYVSNYNEELDDLLRFEVLNINTDKSCTLDIVSLMSLQSLNGKVFFSNCEGIIKWRLLTFSRDSIRLSKLLTFNEKIDIVEPVCGIRSHYRFRKLIGVEPEFHPFVGFYFSNVYDFIIDVFKNYGMYDIVRIQGNKLFLFAQDKMVRVYSSAYVYTISDVKKFEILCSKILLMRD